MFSLVILAGALALQGSLSAQDSAGSAASTAPATRAITAQERGDIFMARKMYREAIDSYKQMPVSAVLLNKIGIAYHQLTDLISAERYYQRASKMDPAFSEPINNLGTVYYAHQSYRRAINQYKKVLRLKPNSAATLANLCDRSTLRFNPRHRFFES